MPVGGAAQEGAAVLSESRVVAAFHHISAKLLLSRDEPVDTGVSGVDDDRETQDEDVALVPGLPRGAATPTPRTSLPYVA